jgi:hypothetical protein
MVSRSESNETASRGHGGKGKAQQRYEDESYDYLEQMTFTDTRDGEGINY